MAAGSAAILDDLSVLGDLNRARVLLALEAQELAVSEICDVLRLPQSTVSRHLKTLTDDAWLVSRREGTSRFYSASLSALPASSRRLWGLVREEVAGTPTAAQDARRLQRAIEARRATSRAFFASAAGEWDRLRDDLFGPTSHLLSCLALLDPKTVLADLGCGTGRASAALAPWVTRVHAIDGSEEMLRAARSRLEPYPNVEVRQANLESLPLEDQSVDLALLLLVLHHIAEPARVLAEVSRVLRRGGTLVVTDMTPHEHEEYRQQMGHVWLGFSDEQIERSALDNGFSSCHIHALPPDARAEGPALFVARAVAGR
ncbi:MAG: metalloregulator ArsR/SmtB family transcription factor [Luteitalea sp.]|nr:metalloregulator ArsR/SmtB family transcription factor [Luteitalea sp.]